MAQKIYKYGDLNIGDTLEVIRDFSEIKKGTLLKVIGIHNNSPSCFELEEYGTCAYDRLNGDAVLRVYIKESNTTSSLLRFPSIKTNATKTILKKRKS